MSFFRSFSDRETSIFSFRKGKSGDVRSTWTREEAKRHRKTKEGLPSPLFLEPQIVKNLTAVFPKTLLPWLHGIGQFAAFFIC